MRKLTSPKHFKKTTKERRQIDSSYVKHELRYQYNNKYFADQKELITRQFG